MPDLLKEYLMKTIGITASIKNNKLIVDRSIIDTVVKLGYLPLVLHQLV